MLEHKAMENQKQEIIKFLKDLKYYMHLNHMSKVSTKRQSRKNDGDPPFMAQKTRKSVEYKDRLIIKV